MLVVADRRNQTCAGDTDVDIAAVTAPAATAADPDTAKRWDDADAIAALLAVALRIDAKSIVGVDLKRITGADEIDVDVGAVRTAAAVEAVEQKAAAAARLAWVSLKSRRLASRQVEQYWQSKNSR